jgi:hypothetical protein
MAWVIANSYGECCGKMRFFRARAGKAAFPIAPGYEAGPEEVLADESG